MREKEPRYSWQRDEIDRRTPPGSSPGTLVVDPEAPRPVIRILAYDPDTIHEETIQDPEAVRSWLARSRVTWINVDGLGDAGVVSQLGRIFGIHRLALEDVINVHQRAKAEQYSSHYFIVARMADVSERLETEQLSMFLGENFVLTFQETQGDCFDPVRDRIRKPDTRIRNSGADYLAYALLDSFIDHNFPVLEHYGELLEELEDEVILNPTDELISRIHEIKRDLITLRRAVWPLREAISSLIRESTLLITDETKIYLRDCYDHTIQIIDLLENYREVASSLMDVYLSSVSNRMNEVMKVLTMFTTIFIPLGFMAGIYGMNFNTELSPWNMPELNWAWGYPFVLVLMAAVVIIMLLFFRRKGWLGQSHS